MLAESDRPAAKIAILLNSKEPTHRLQWESAVEAAKALQLELVRVDVSGPGGWAAALDRLPGTGARGLFAFADDRGIIEHRVRISEGGDPLQVADDQRSADSLGAGALISYGMDMSEEFRQSAAYVVSKLQWHKAGGPAY